MDFRKTFEHIVNENSTVMSNCPLCNKASTYVDVGSGRLVCPGCNKTKEEAENTNESKINEVIKQVGDKWQVQSHKGRNLGTFSTKEEAEKRLKEVEMFKHMKESKPEIKSILEPIVTKAREMVDAGVVSVEDIKKYVIGEVKKHTKVNPKDLTKMLMDINRQRDAFQLLKYLYNALLKYEGMGTIQKVGQAVEMVEQNPNKPHKVLKTTKAMVEKEITQLKKELTDASKYADNEELISSLKKQIADKEKDISFINEGKNSIEQCTICGNKDMEGSNISYRNLPKGSWKSADICYGCQKNTKDIEIQESKVNEKTTWLDLGWDVEVGSAPDISGWTVKDKYTEKEYSVIGADEKYIQVEGHDDIPLGDGFVYSKQFELIAPNGKTVKVDLRESKINEDEGLTGNNATTVQPEIPPVVQDVPEEPVEEKPMVEVEPKEKAGPVKEYLGNNGSDTYFYLVTVANEEGIVSELQVLDANEEPIYTTKDSALDPNDIKGFILAAIKEKEIANISTDLMDKYLFPTETPEEVVAEEGQTEEIETPTEENPIQAKGEPVPQKPVEAIDQLMNKFKLNEITLETDHLFDAIITPCKQYLDNKKVNLNQVDGVLDDVRHELGLMYESKINEKDMIYAMKMVDMLKAKGKDNAYIKDVLKGSLTDEEIDSLLKESKIDTLLEKYQLNEEEADLNSLMKKYELDNEEVRDEEIPTEEPVEEIPEEEVNLPPTEELAKETPVDVPMTDAPQVAGEEAPVDIPTTPEEARTKIQLEYPEEPFTSLALAYADGLVDDPVVYGSVRKLQYEGVWTKADDFKKMAKIVGELNNFKGTETADILIGKFKGDSSKYRIGRDNVVVVDIVVRDMGAEHSLEAIKDLVGASEVKDMGEGMVKIKW